MPRKQYNFTAEERFVEIVDWYAKLTGSTRADFVRRALEHYIKELKDSSIFSSRH